MEVPIGKDCFDEETFKELKIISETFEGFENHLCFLITRTDSKEKEQFEKKLKEEHPKIFNSGAKIFLFGSLSEISLQDENQIDLKTFQKNLENIKEMRERAKDFFLFFYKNFEHNFFERFWNLF